MLEADESLAVLYAAVENLRHANVRAQRLEAFGFGGKRVGAPGVRFLQESF